MSTAPGKIILGRFLAVALSAFGGMALAADVEAKKDGVPVYADATNKSEVLEKLVAGATLAAGERKGMFWGVTTKSGKPGFVSIMAVKHKPDAGSGLANAIKGVVKEGRPEEGGTEGRQRSAVMGVRGLREDDDASNAGNVRPNLRAVYAMEDRQVTKAELDRLGEDVFEAIAKKAGID